MTSAKRKKHSSGSAELRRTIFSWSCAGEQQRFARRTAGAAAVARWEWPRKRLKKRQSVLCCGYDDVREEPSRDETTVVLFWMIERDAN
jgi:hypothetical protein